MLKKEEKTVEDLQNAKGHLQECLRLNPNHPRKVKIKNAIAGIDKTPTVSSAKPAPAPAEKKTGKTPYEMGIEAYKKGRWNEAVKLFSKAILVFKEAKKEEKEIDENILASAHLNLAKSYLKKPGNETTDLLQAKGHLDEYLDLRPRAKDAAKVRNTIQNIENRLKKSQE